MEASGNQQAHLTASVVVLEELKLKEIQLLTMCGQSCAVTEIKSERFDGKFDAKKDIFEVVKM